MVYFDCSALLLSDLFEDCLFLSRLRSIDLCMPALHFCLSRGRPAATPQALLCRTHTQRAYMRTGRPFPERFCVLVFFLLSFFFVVRPTLQSQWNISSSSLSRPLDVWLSVCCVRLQCEVSFRYNVHSHLSFPGSLGPDHVVRITSEIFLTLNHIHLDRKGQKGLRYDFTISTKRCMSVCTLIQI